VSVLLTVLIAILPSFAAGKTSTSETSIAGSSANIVTASILDISSGYKKNPVTPKFLYVISLDSLTPGERTMIVSLQGLVNPNSSSQIYTLNSSQPDYKIWLEDFINNYKVSLYLQ
jgi:hypothetical protein